MSYTVESIDRTALPAAFLPLAKSQSRIPHDRDDAFLTEQIAQAIDDIERQTNSTFFERIIVLDPALAWAPWWSSDLAGVALPSDCVLVNLPFNNVTALVVLDTDGLDISANYEVAQTDPGGVGACALVAPATAPAPAANRFTFTAGCPDLDAMSPSVRRAILRRTAALYENREAPEGLAEPMEPGAPLLWRPDV